MKKALIFFSLATLIVSACSKNEINVVDRSSDEITFQTLAMATRVDGTVFPTTETFSTYAWAVGTAGTYFMNNETIAFNTTENAWKTQGGTYYWPKNSTVDFISYYPTGLSGITVEEDKITYTDIDVNTLQQDIMYADKAAGFSNNVDLADDGANAYTGVPTIFHHALAKVKFIVELKYNEKTEADGTKTKWEVTLNNVSLGDIYTKGGCVLNLATTPTSGVIGWTKPADANGYNVWTPDGTKAALAGAIVSGTVLTPGTDYNAVSELYVLPQALAAGAQKVALSYTVKTYRNGTLFLTENINTSADIFLATLPAWQMNHAYTYRLKLNPLASNGNGGNPDDPSNPVDPTDPDLSDVIITFDPAVDGWENVGVETVINI